jgi:ABC-type molybdate transport system substrate-binding protein
MIGARGGTMARWVNLKALGVGLALALAAVAAGPRPRTATYPPWSRGNDPARQGYVFRVATVDNVPDLHGNPLHPRLTLFVGGNQFMVMPRLIRAFVRLHPRLRGRIFYETLPPGILLRQMQRQDTLTLGNLTLQVAPDVYEAGARKVQALRGQGLVRRTVAYASNDLEIMVRQGNPLHVRGLNDLGRVDVRVAMPNPAWEGVERQIAAALRRAGGARLVTQVMVAKLRAGTTALTHVHHRQTPLRILLGESDAGVTWASEVRFQEQLGHAIAGVPIPPGHNVTALYEAGLLADAPHPRAAAAWLDFLASPAARQIYAAFGFGAPEAAAVAR